MKKISTKQKMKALQHECPFLIEKLLKEHIVETEEEAQALFMEVKKYLVLVQVDPQKSWQMYSLRIDEVWHQFVLFTREYVDFCSTYFDVYVHHVPSNAPTYESDEIDQHDEAAGETLESTATHVPTLDEFATRYKEFFGEDLPDLWLDDTSVNLNRRVVNYHAGDLQVRDAEQGMIDLVLTTGGAVLISVSDLARDALTFIAQTGAFYVRELPGGLEDDEKAGLVGILVESKALRVAP